MTVAKAAALGAEIKAAVEAALTAYPTITVRMTAAKTALAEHIRLDGFDVNDASYKNGEQGRHAFEVHHFLRPLGNETAQNGITRAQTILAVIHAALMAGRFQGSGLRHEYLTAENDPDGVTTHGISRYTALIR